jgi:hypothetical protein
MRKTILLIVVCFQFCLTSVGQNNDTIYVTKTRGVEPSKSRSIMVLPTDSLYILVNFFDFGTPVVKYGGHWVYFKSCESISTFIITKYRTQGPRDIVIVKNTKEESAVYNCVLKEFKKANITRIYFGRSFKKV